MVHSAALNRAWFAATWHLTSVFASDTCSISSP